MTGLVFLGALSAALFAFELLDGLAITGAPPGRLQGVASTRPEQALQRRSSWDAVLVLLLPGYFAAGSASGGSVVELLRRSGYPYYTTGEFFAAAMHTFTLFMAAAGLVAGLLLSLQMPLLVAVGTAGAMVWLGLRRPYSRLRSRIRRRAKDLRNNMLTGLAILNALLSSGVSVQDSLRRSAGIGGPFCNLLGLLVAQMEVTQFLKAVETVEAHLPDASDVEAGLFLRAVREFYSRNRPLLPAVRGLQTAVQRDVLEATETQAALVRQRSGLFGVLAVLGLVITIIAPFISAIT